MKTRSDTVLIYSTLVWGACSAFQIRAPTVSTKLPSLPTTRSSKAITTTSLPYKNEVEDADDIHGNVLNLKSSLQPLVVPPEAKELKGQLLEKIFDDQPGGDIQTRKRLVQQQNLRIMEKC